MCPSSAWEAAEAEAREVGAMAEARVAEARVAVARGEVRGEEAMAVGEMEGAVMAAAVMAAVTAEEVMVAAKVAPHCQCPRNSGRHGASIWHRRCSRHVVAGRHERRYETRMDRSASIRPKPRRTRNHVHSLCAVLRPGQTECKGELGTDGNERLLAPRRRYEGSHPFLCVSCRRHLQRSRLPIRAESR
jgi:hypothetical protein